MNDEATPGLLKKLIQIVIVVVIREVFANYSQTGGILSLFYLLVLVLFAPSNKRTNIFLPSFYLYPPIHCMLNVSIGLIVSFEKKKKLGA